VLAPPAPQVVAAALESWNAARKRSNVLAVYDISGSMKEPVPGTGGTKIDLVKKAALAALPLFAPETQLGTWVFSTNLEGRQDWHELVSIGPAEAKLPNGKTRREVLAGALSGLQASNGDTGLYDTTLAAFRAVKRSYAPGRLNIVVLLTDGINDDPDGGITKDELLTRLKAEQGNRKIAIITVAFGADADVATLRQISQQTNGITYVIKDPRDIVRLFTEAITKLPVG
jgi:Ca-activated chloride channel family protein